MIVFAGLSLFSANMWWCDYSTPVAMSPTARANKSVFETDVYNDEAGRKHIERCHSAFLGDYGELWRVCW